ncbi:formate dehydrogenase accessory protein FdhE domain-containing protein [Pyrobaculum calidifontis]|uniref:Formate dehydrogenase accessory protein FdhE n=1 Tax=Pyrobaculum calidifontis (strain DSM 21063 / JCM 11548 / VA1) TaxID=410359 RepID=A3MT61_PYRCJ|nr:formate dehydrogenase accessory protein FdhE [Pyrobaculum calidifontis]ABO07828.1 hypothetical protein Pcal_0393 [Pyrobaculum calidifontis JCM 11548]
MSKEVEIVCGGDSHCVEEVRRAVEEIRSLFSTPIPEPHLSSLSPPLVDQVANMAEIVDAVGDEAAARLVVASRLAKRFAQRFAEWSGDRCPICGSAPRLFVVVPRPGEIFESRERYAKCVCGFSWLHEGWWRCPNCGAEGRQNFDVYIREGLEGAVFYRCRRCGFAYVEYQGLPREDLEYLLRIVVGHVAGGQRD